MAAKMPTIGAGQYGFLGLETKTGTASRIADQQLKRAQKDPTKLAPSEAAKQAAIARKMASTRADIQQQTEALAESALGGTSVQAGALRDAGTDLGETLVEGEAAASADVEAAGQQQQFAELERIKGNAKEAREAKKAGDAQTLKYLGMGAAAVGTIVGGPAVGKAILDITSGIGTIKAGTTEEEEEEEAAKKGTADEEVT